MYYNGGFVDTKPHPNKKANGDRISIVALSFLAIELLPK